MFILQGDVIKLEKILKKIVDKRRETILRKGITFEVEVPAERNVPISLPDFTKKILISEIKRGSPSEGKMNDILDSVKWAGEYINAGADAISILTEEDFFYGSLNDLINIKKQYPDMTVLRKDFLLSVDEIDISYRAGADMVLLITGVLVGSDNDLTLIREMKVKAEILGMLPLIEVHNKEELHQILPLNPKLIGINSRDLKTFKMNRGYPIALKTLINKDTKVIFESGIRNGTDSFFVGMSDFAGVLVGSSIVKSGDLQGKISNIKSGLKKGSLSKNDFYSKIFKKIYLDKKTIVKVCGITNYSDAEKAVDEGADLIGFILAKSPRQVKIEEAKKIASQIDENILKVGVVVNDNIEEAVNAVKEGWFDALQFHGDISNEKADSYGVCWYKAVRVKSNDDFNLKYYSPIILYDAFSKEAYGGTGKQIDKELLDYAINNDIDLYLAGGLNPDNIENILKEYCPLMIDVSSGLEEKPGKKDHEKIKKFFKIINKYNMSK